MMKHLHTFESYLSSLNEEFNSAGFAELMAAMGAEMAKMDMALELMADEPDELELARKLAAKEIVEQFIAAVIKEDIPREKLPKIKLLLSTFKTKFPELAEKSGLEQACKDMTLEMSKVMEFEAIDSKADISEDAEVNRIAKAGEDDIKAGVKALTDHTNKFIKNLFA